MLGLLAADFVGLFALDVFAEDAAKRTGAPARDTQSSGRQRELGDRPAPGAVSQCEGAVL